MSSYVIAAPEAVAVAAGDLTTNTGQPPDESHAELDVVRELAPAR